MARSKVKKDQFASMVRRIVRNNFPQANTASCLYHALGSLVVGHHLGIRLTLQAGSMLWPFVDAINDDGVSPNVFGYQWNGSTDKARRMQNHDGAIVLPEMHIWVGSPITQEIVDLTTCFLPEQCKKIIGEDWRASAPPDYFWGRQRDLPFGAVYEPNIEATMLAAQLIKTVL